MDVREKLFTLFQDCNNPSWKWFPNNAEMLKLIDYLISHGITVQEWIPVAERLPKHGEVILCHLTCDELRILQWDNIYKWFLGYGSGDDWQQKNVTHWMPLPQPPKGE